MKSKERTPGLSLIERTTPIAARYGLSSTAHCAMIAITFAALGQGNEIKSVTATPDS